MRSASASVCEIGSMVIGIDNGLLLERQRDRHGRELERSSFTKKKLTSL